MKIKSFQVKTCAPEVKRLLRELYDKHVEKSTFTDDSCNNVSPSFVQFWIEPDFETNGRNTGITYYSDAWRPEICPVISLEEAIVRLTSYVKPKNVEIFLNPSHTAVVFPDGSVVVGCQTFKPAVILNLADAVKKALDRE